MTTGTYTRYDAIWGIVPTSGLRSGDGELRDCRTWITAAETPARPLPRGGMRQKPDGLVTASEIAAFAYCPEQWRLQYGLGLRAENQAALGAGTRHHERKALAER